MIAPRLPPYLFSSKPGHQQGRNQSISQARLGQKLAKLISGPGPNEPERAGPTATGSAERLSEVLGPSGLRFGSGLASAKNL